MKHLAIVVFILIHGWLQAQQNPLFAGTKTPYPKPTQHHTAAPAGFTPIFVNYVGRHGSRFLTKAESDINVLQVLTLAEKNNGLLPAGKQIKAMTVRFLEIEKTNYENITLLGREEQRGIGQRILNLYKDAFAGNGIEIIMTHKVRTQQSADAFMQVFSTYAGKKNYRVMADSLDNCLRFYDLSPAYLKWKKGNAVRQHMDSLDYDKRTISAADKICSRIFIRSFADSLTKAGVIIEVQSKQVKMNAVSFADNLYELYCIQFSVPEEMQQKGFSKDSINFGIVFTRPELEWLTFRNGASDFLEKGAGTDTLGLQVRIAVPLLVDFLNSTDSTLSRKKKADAILRFTHAEAIAPLATLLGIPEASIPAASIYQYNKHWSADSIIPLSANIQWIFYSNGNKYLLKVLLNEKEVSLPIVTSKFPYYEWDDVKAYYTKKLKQLKIDVNSDMGSYLREVQ